MTRYQFRDFCKHLASQVNNTRLANADPTQMLADLLADEVSLYVALTVVQLLNPSFHIPAQVLVDELTLRDVHHFYSVMGEEHLL